MKLQTANSINSAFVPMFKIGIGIMIAIAIANIFLPIPNYTIKAIPIITCVMSVYMMFLLFTNKEEVKQLGDYDRYTGMVILMISCLAFVVSLSLLSKYYPKHAPFLDLFSSTFSLAVLLTQYVIVAGDYSETASSNIKTS